MADTTNMRNIIFLFLVVVLSSCARARVVSWKDNEFTVCCQNNICGQEKLNELAINRCPAAHAIGGHETDGATTISKRGFGWGEHQVAETSKHQCMVYECK